MVGRSYRAAALIGGLIMVAGVAGLLQLDPARGPLWAAAAASVLGLGMGFSNTHFRDRGADQRRLGRAWRRYLREYVLAHDRPIDRHRFVRRDLQYRDGPSGHGCG